jgi:DNA-binding transcriptional ArsR family regulator
MLNMLAMKNNQTKLSETDKRLVRILQVLGDPSRYKIFKILLEKKQLCVSEIAGKMDISVPAVSQHFKTFELVGIVEKERMGQKICYQIKDDDKLLKQLVKIVNKRKGE